MQNWIQLKLDARKASEMVEMMTQENLQDNLPSLIPYGEYNVLIDDVEALRFITEFSNQTPGSKPLASQWSLQSYLLNFTEDTQTNDLETLLSSSAWTETDLKNLEKLNLLLSHPILAPTVNPKDLDFLYKNILLAKDFGMLAQVIQSFENMLGRVVLYEDVVNQGHPQYQFSIINRNVNLRDLAAQTMCFIALADLQQVLQNQTNQLVPPQLSKLNTLMNDLISAKMIAVYEPNYVNNDQEARYIFVSNTLYFGKALDRPLFTASDGILLSQMIIHELTHALQDKESTASTVTTQAIHEAEAYFNEVAYVYFKLGAKQLEENLNVAKSFYKAVWQPILTHQGVAAELSSAFQQDLATRIPASFVHNHAYQALQNYFKNPGSYSTILTALAEKWTERTAMDDIYGILSEKPIATFIKNAKAGLQPQLALANQLAINGTEVFLQKESWPLPSGKNLMKAAIENFTNNFKTAYHTFGIKNPDLQMSFFEQKTEFKRSILVNFIYQAAASNIDVEKYFTDEVLPKLKWVNGIFQDHPEALGI